MTQARLDGQVVGCCRNWWRANLVFHQAFGAKLFLNLQTLNFKLDSRNTFSVKKRGSADDGEV